MKAALNTIDAAIKRLVTPVTMFIAAALLSKGLDKPDANPSVIKFLMGLLALWALVYMFFSAWQALKEFQEQGIGKIRMAFISLSFLLVYIVLFFSALKMGLDKLGG